MHVGSRVATTDPDPQLLRRFRHRYGSPSGSRVEPVSVAGMCSRGLDLGPSAWTTRCCAGRAAHREIGVHYSTVVSPVSTVSGNLTGRVWAGQRAFAKVRARART